MNRHLTTSPRHVARRGLLLVAAAAGLAFGAPASASPWLDDYAVLKAAMEANYANLAWFASPQGGVDLPRLDRRTTEALTTAATADEARAAIRNFLAALDDGHFSVLPPPPADAGPAETEPPLPSLAGADAANGCAALGYANRSPIAFSLPFESLPGFTLLTTGETSGFRAGLLSVGAARIGIIRIRNFNPSQYPEICAAAWAAATVAQREDREGFSERDQEQWLRSLAATIVQLGAQRPDALIVDVGSNSGGNDSGDWAARLFTRQALRSARMLMRPGPAAQQYLSEEIEALETAIGAATDSASRQAGERALTTLRSRRDAAGHPGCDLRWVWRERRAWAPSGCSGLIDAGFASGIVDYQPADAVRDPAISRRIYWPAVADPLIGRWNGPLFVLTNSATYSSAEMFAAVLQNNRAARIVGTASGGDGCGFVVDTEPLTLPNLALRIRMPNCVRLRADASNEVAGIQPDIPVLPREGESPRARAMRLLRTIAAEAASVRR